MTTVATAPIFSKYLTLAQTAANETESIVEYSKQFLNELADENIDALFPRQGQLNDKHTEKLLARFEMAQQQQKQQQQPHSAPAAAAVAAPTVTALPLMAETPKKVDTVVVPLTPEKNKKKPAIAATGGDDDDDVDDKVPPSSTAAAATATKKSSASASEADDDDDESGDDDSKFNEELEKVATKSKNELTNDTDGSGSDDGLSSDADSVDLEIASDGADDGEESSDDEAYGADIVDGAPETSTEKYSNEVISRLLRTSKESLNEKIKANAAMIRKMTPAGDEEDESDDDDEEFNGEDGDDDNAAASSTSDDANNAEADNDDDDNERPRKKAKTTLQSAMKKNGTAPTTTSKKSKTVRIAGDDVGDENAAARDAEQPPKKKAKVTARVSDMSAEEKAIATLQQMRMSERHKKKKEWVSTQVLKDVVTIACNNIFMRDLAKREGKPFSSFFKTVRNDTDDDDLVRRLRLNLLNLTMQIQSALSMSKMHGNEVMQEITDFVRNAKQVRVVDKQGSKHTECAILGLNFAPALIDKLVADHYTSETTTIAKTMFVCSDLRELIEAMAFLVNFEERLEELTKNRLVSVLGYRDGKTGAAEAVRLLRDDPAEKSAHELLRIRLKKCIDIVDRSMRIIKTAQAKATKE